METLIKFTLVACIIVGGLTLMAHFAPKYLGMCLFHVGEYAVTGSIMLIAVLFYAGIKAIK